MLAALEKLDKKGIACDSREVRDDYIFVAVKGEKIDGHDYIDDAIDRGAKIVILERDIFVKKGVTKIVVDDTRAALTRLSNVFYNYPYNKINTVGITGTKGKTTISYLIEAILQANEIAVGLIGTINYRLDKRVIPAVNTTPAPPLLYKLGADMLTNGITHCVMEVSSHALEQKRVDGIKFNYAVFSNLTRDHLDYHKTLNFYFDAKLRLFKMLDDKSFAIINRDDKFFKKIKAVVKGKVVSYGFLNNANIKYDGKKRDEIFVKYPEGRVGIKFTLIGRHNIYNMLAAFAAAYSMGIKIEKIKQGLEGIKIIPGRLEKLTWQEKGIDIFIDYAHTHDSLKKVLIAVKEIGYKKVIVVFGCGGDRDKGKRKKMGFAAWRYADYSYITTDNPRSEEPAKIAEQVLRGFIFRNKVKVELDRAEAIKSALLKAKQGDAVIIAGKGHETYQIFKSTIAPFSDKAVVLGMINLK